MKPRDLLARLEAGYEYDPMYGELCNERDRLADENVKLRELCKELLDLCYDAYEQKWGWDDDWALAYEQAKKLGVEVHE